MKKTIKIPGEIIDVAENHVEVVCLVSEEKKFFGKRLFSIDVLEGVVDLSVNSFIEITVTTAPGKITYEFAQAGDLSELFKKPDYFADFKDSPFSGTKETHVFAVTGETHGAMVEAVNQLAAAAAFHKKYPGEDILSIRIKDIPLFYH